MNIKHKIIAISAAVLILAAALVFIFADKPLKITEEEALAVLTDLVPKSHEINRILFGEGLPVGEDSEKDNTTAVEYTVIKDGGGYTSIAEIKEAAEKVYSKQYLKGVYVGAFEGEFMESEQGVIMTVSPRYREIGGKLYIDVKAQKLNIRDKLEVVSVKVGKRTPKYIKLDTVCRENGKELELEMVITKENGAWRLDAPTY